MPARADAYIVLCTCPARDVAEELARAAVEQRLAACVNIIPGVASIYAWQGAIERAEEVLLLAKTRAASYAALEAMWRSRHPYELAEVIAVPIATGSEPYLQWISDATTRCS